MDTVYILMAAASGSAVAFLAAGILADRKKARKLATNYYALSGAFTVAVSLGFLVPMVISPDVSTQAVNITLWGLLFSGGGLIIIGLGSRNPN